MVSNALAFKRSNSTLSQSKLYASRVCIGVILSFVVLHLLIGYLYYYTGSVGEDSKSDIDSTCQSVDNVTALGGGTCDDKRFHSVGSSMFRKCNANDNYEDWTVDIHIGVVSSLCILSCVLISRLSLTSLRDQDDLGTFANYLASLTVNVISTVSTLSTLVLRWGGTCEDVFG